MDARGDPRVGAAVLRVGAPVPLVVDAVRHAGQRRAFGFALRNVTPRLVTTSLPPVAGLNVFWSVAFSDPRRFSVRAPRPVARWSRSATTATR